MDFFDKAKEIIGVTGQKTEEVINLQKLRFRAATLSHKINNNFERLGKLYYKSLTGSDFENELNTIVAEIEELTVEHKALQQQICEMKGTVVCAECGATVSNSYEYCFKCGHKL